MKSGVAITSHLRANYASGNTSIKLLASSNETKKKKQKEEKYVPHSTNVMTFLMTLLPAIWYAKVFQLLKN